ncbi:MAG: hypothetical protein AAF501_01725 [Pseudomonadota bacterium]
MVPDVSSIIALFFLTAIIVETALRIPLMSETGRAAHWVKCGLRTMLRARVSDHWKERVLLGYAGRLFVSIFRICVMFAALASVAAICIFGLAQILAGFDGFVLSIAGIVWSTGLAVLVFGLRKGIVGRGV